MDKKTQVFFPSRDSHRNPCGKKKPLLALLNGFNLRINTKNYFIRIHYLKKKTLSIFVENTKEIHVSVLKFGIETEVDKIL